MPTISVIIPNFNNAAYVATAIASVLAQSYQDVEIIVIDDGSTDDSRAVITQFGEQVHYHWQANQGLAAARNKGIRVAQGDWIALLDADDQWLPTYLATMLALTKDHPNGVVYYCAAQCMDQHGHDLPRRLGAPVGPPETTYQTLVRANFLIPSTILLRRQVVVAAGLFDPRLRACEDWDLWLRLGPQQRFIGTSACLVRYRVHNTSLSANVTGMHQAAQAVVEKNFGLNDGQYQAWSQTKQRAYGGLYRYFVLTLVQRQNNWTAAAMALSTALQMDHSLATDLDLFYELAWGNQPVGYRGTTYALNLAFNLAQVEALLQTLYTKLSAAGSTSAAAAHYRRLCGTAYYALGLACYHTGHVADSRRFFVTALRHRPALGRDVRFTGTLIRSFAGPKARQWFRQVRRQVSV